jgi:3-isopropylmalate/(R)-2-methylmalate dehydratase small subunit
MSVLDTKIIRVKSRAVAVPGDDIDTDRIMPARFLKCVTFADLGRHAFEDERFDPSTKQPKGHPFDDPKRKGAGILVANKNFGCGSSREHAPQGLLRWGIKAIIAESFAEIFAGNCTVIGLPTATASEADVRRLMAFVQAHPEDELEFDIDKKRVTFGGESIAVEVKESARKLFLEGTWDSAATLLAAQGELKTAFERIPYVKWLKAS